MKQNAIDVHAHVEFERTHTILKKRYTDEDRRKIMQDNAISLFGLRGA